jgi:hypothetical protein
MSFFNNNNKKPGWWIMFKQSITVFPLSSSVRKQTLMHYLWNILLDCYNFKHVSNGNTIRFCKSQNLGTKMNNIGHITVIRLTCSLHADVCWFSFSWVICNAVCKDATFSLCSCNEPLKMNTTLSYYVDTAR